MPLDEARLAPKTDRSRPRSPATQLSARPRKFRPREISRHKIPPQKLRVLDWLKQFSRRGTLNFVIHRKISTKSANCWRYPNPPSATAVDSPVQYYGWAFAIANGLCPHALSFIVPHRTLTSAQTPARPIRNRVRSSPDYYARNFPKPHGRWGRQCMLITSDRRALPCHGAVANYSRIALRHSTDRSCRESRKLPRRSKNFAVKTGCRPLPNLDRRDKIFGGCRCQALLLPRRTATPTPSARLAPTRAKVYAI